MIKNKATPLTHALLAGAALVLTSCGEAGAPATPTSPDDAVQTQENEESARLNAWFEAQWEARLARSPMFQTSLGRKTNYDKWDDVSDEFSIKSHALHMASLVEMKQKFDFEKLSPADKLSYRLYEYGAEQARDSFPFRNHDYRFSHFVGAHSAIPAFLINQHRVSSVDDAEAYIARLSGVSDYLGAHQAGAAAQFENGIYPPQWSYEKMIGTARNIISGAPFDEAGEPSTILADFQKKVSALDVDEATKTDLLARGTQALMSSVQPAYEQLITMFEAQMARASNDDGAWKLPDGSNYYASNLREMTTTDLTAAEIHELGLSEVARIHEEMRSIKNRVGFDASLQEFFVFMREDPDGQFTYPDTDEGRAAYLADATAMIDTMRERLDELFISKPNAKLEVKRVEAYRERAGSKAFYQRPAPNGARPGIYYANLYNMADMPSYQMEALAYHEGIPGHHMQIAIAQELENVPSFRKYGHYTAYSEGWGLYSEFIPKEMGFYADPYSDFGRLAMELWRAARLVVDTGLHDKKWTREEAIDYLVENTPNPEGDCVKAIERYAVLPGQATAYKIGMLKILELRQEAESILGDDFDIREFHDVFLANGAVPLSILEENVDAWVASKKPATQ